MKKTTYICDLCNNSLSEIEEPFILEPKTATKKQLGHDIVLTPRGSRLNVKSGNIVLRVNASFYCGQTGTEQLHFHQCCIETAATKRIVQFFDYLRD